MIKLEKLTTDTSVRGILPNEPVTVIHVRWYGSDALELMYKSQTGKIGSQLLYRHDEPRLEIIENGRPWSFDGDGKLFRLVSEANRIRLAYLFDPLLAIHTSSIDPLPHQITAVYEAMLPRHPLRFLLADDPGAGKTIMAGLLIKELIIRGDLQRCLIVCPGNLVEQWQDELNLRFQLPFEILTNDKIEASGTGNWFRDQNLVIARLDQLKQNEPLQQKLSAPDCFWDLIVCDEAHKLSASYTGGEIKYTKRHRLGQLLSKITRHFLLLTATPHNGKEADFQLFLSLLDGDRFEGRFRDGVHQADISDLMRRMVKEKLVKFDGTPLFPERIAHTIPYKLSDPEAQLYTAVTEYVSKEFDRAAALLKDRRVGTVGFALTILQRRLASSPEAIYQSLARRRKKLESRLNEAELLHRGMLVDADSDQEIDEEDDDEEELSDTSLEFADQATAARSITELRAEIQTLFQLEALALKVRSSGEDCKWRALESLLGELFNPTHPNQKIVVFTEHRDTLFYLQNRVTSFLGKNEAVVVIHGGMGREDRHKAQDAFINDPQVQVLIATDAAGEGINLQRAHFMVNYDLPWNMNRLEQRFGRIHRIGQTEVCYLWNLLAPETREGDVYRTLLEKLDEARKALGGQVYDVLGRLQFNDQSLRDLLIEAIRYGERPDVRAKLTQVISGATDQQHLQDLIDEKSLSHEILDMGRISKIREEMERAEARRLQPHYIESFFLEAFKRLGGQIYERETGRYEITHVPGPIRSRDRMIGIGPPVSLRYERIAFDKSLISSQPLAVFVCPGYALLDATIDLTLEQHRSLLRQGAILVDASDRGTKPRLLYYLEHAIQDASQTKSGEPRTISKRMLHIEVDDAGTIRHLECAPYLDYRSLIASEPSIEELLAQPECGWISHQQETRLITHAITAVVPNHLAEVTERRFSWIKKTREAVKERLVKEINYWDHRAQMLKDQERSGKFNPSRNSQDAQRKADELQTRLVKRMEQLDLEQQISSQPPVIIGGALIIPQGLIDRMDGSTEKTDDIDRLAVADEARRIVMEIERSLGYEPVDREKDKIGYDIESRDPKTGHLRFLEVKGRSADAQTITVTRNEILTSLNKPDDFILAIVSFDKDTNSRYKPFYIRRPFHREPDFYATSVNYSFADLLKYAEEPS